MIYMCTSTGCRFDGHAHQPAKCPACKADLESIEVPSGEDIRRLIEEAMKEHGLSSALAATLLMRQRQNYQGLLELARHSIADALMLAFTAELALRRARMN